MKRTLSLSLLFSLLFLFSCSDKQHIGFDLKKIHSNNKTISRIHAGEEFEGEVLHIKPTPIEQSLTIWVGEDARLWENAKYLVCEIWHKNEYSAVLNLEFYRKDLETGNSVVQSRSDVGEDTGRPRISAKIGVLPFLKTKLIFPLEHLNGQDIFMKRFPRQLKGTVLGKRMRPGEISRAAIRFGPYQAPHFLPEYEIAAVYLTKDIPEPYPTPDIPLTDKFGQWARKDWPGKIKTEAELKTLLEAQLKSADKASFPGNWSRYGGWTEKRFAATGFFRTHHDGERWWLVDPDGFAFISVGIDCIGHNASGVTTGQEDLFEWLPDPVEDRFQEVSTQRGEYAFVDFYKANLIRVFGKDWREKWETVTSGQIRELGINTIANWSDIGYARRANIPYVLPLGRFPSTKVMLFRDFPDVFAAEYEENAKKFAQQLDSFKDDPFLIGYFLRNEPNWAFGAHDLAFEMFGTPESSESKKAFTQWLARRYPSIQEMNRHWNLELSRFEDISGKIFNEYPSEKAKEDFWDFSEILVAQYINVPCDEVEKVDPNHLNLGMRYAWISSDLLFKAGERFDVFSINGYGNPGPPPTAEITRISGKPVMIGEFHFGATDRGLPASGIQGTLSQAERGKAYRYYIEQGLVQPEIIGMHYFQWLDQPIFGRFDGENYNIGFLDICSRPYQELKDAAILTHKRMYEVANGDEKPFNKLIEKIPAIHY